MGEMGEGVSIACDFLGKALVVPFVIMMASDEPKDKKEFSALKNPVAATIQLGLEAPVLFFGSKLIGKYANKGFFDKNPDEFSYNEKLFRDKFVKTIEQVSNADDTVKKMAPDLIENLNKNGYTKKMADEFSQTLQTLGDSAKAPLKDSFKRFEKAYKNQFHSQPYWPQWLLDQETLVFRGTRLPDNGVDESGNGTYYVLSQFEYGYADNVPNLDEGYWNEDAKIDIDWAIDVDGNSVKMPGVDFVKIYTGVNQDNGWIGENSTEVCRVIDAHVTREGSSPVLDETIAVDKSVLEAFLEKYANGNTSSVTTIADNSNLRVYLDANTGCVRFTAPTNGLAQVYNQSGILLYSATFAAGDNHIDLGSYPAGLYLVRVDGKTTKILKH